MKSVQVREEETEKMEERKYLYLMIKLVTQCFNFIGQGEGQGQEGRAE